MQLSGDSDPAKWECPPHTKAKHDILARYLGGWFPVLSSWRGRIVYLDGFAGRGRYTDGAEGSPLIALRTLLHHQYFPRMLDREFVFLLVEADQENAASLKAEVDRFMADHAPWPTNVKVQVRHAKFDQTAQELIDYLKEQKANLAPTFAFVDPFGYSGLPMDLLADLLNYPQTELFVNFMVGHVGRFITRDGQENAMRGLFGIDVSDILSRIDEDEARADQLRLVYESQIRERLTFPFVNAFAMKNTTGNVGYYLIHGTRSLKGVELMKDAMWKADPGGGFTFSDRRANEDVLFEPTPDLTRLRGEVATQFRGRRGVPIAEIEKFVTLYTAYLKSHVRKGALTPLEKDQEIVVHRPGRSGFPEGTTVDFS